MDQISRRQVVQGAAAAVAMTLGAPSVRAQKDNQILRFGAEADLKVLDPVWTTAHVTRNHGYLVYDTLLGTDESFRIKPQMVDRTVVSSDGMKYTFRLRDGLRWHDGKPVLSEDCVESLKRWERKIAWASSSWRTPERSAPLTTRPLHSNWSSRLAWCSTHWERREATFRS